MLRKNPLPGWWVYKNTDTKELKVGKVQDGCLWDFKTGIGQPICDLDEIVFIKMVYFTNYDYEKVKK